MIGADQVQVVYAAYCRVCLGQTVLIVVAMVVAMLILANLGEVDFVWLWDRSDWLGNYFGWMVFDFAWETLVDDLANWYRRGGRWLCELGVIFLIVIYVILFGMVLVVLGVFVAARLLALASWVCWVMCCVFEFACIVLELVFAVLFVFSFGIGLLVGVLAIALHMMGALGKLFSEVAENADFDLGYLRYWGHMAAGDALWRAVAGGFGILVLWPAVIRDQCLCGVGVGIRRCGRHWAGTLHCD